MTENSTFSDAADMLITFSKSTDNMVGVFVGIMLIVGATGNLVGITYFAGKNERSQNSLFFNRLYLLICVCDLIICLMFVANMDALFTHNRAGVLFGHKTSCEIWGFLWSICSQSSIYLVAILSISRLFILKYPTKRIIPALAWIVPGTFIGCYAAITLSVAFYYTKKIEIMQYRPLYLGCGLSVSPSGPRTSFLKHANPHASYTAMILVMLLTNTSLLLTFVTICCSFVISLVTLCKQSARRPASNRRNHQRYATVTVIIVILVYIFCNIPLLLTNFILARRKIKLDSKLPDKVDVQEYRELVISEVLHNFQDGFLGHYILFMVGGLSVGLNSMINPFVYLCRMSRYRRFVMGAVGRMFLFIGFTTNSNHDNTADHNNDANMNDHDANNDSSIDANNDANIEPNIDANIYINNDANNDANNDVNIDANMMPMERLVAHRPDPQSLV